MTDITLSTTLYPKLWERVETLYHQKHYTHVVREATLVLTEKLREKSTLDPSVDDGHRLVDNVLGGNNPKILTGEGQQKTAFIQLVKDVYTLIRNPAMHQSVEYDKNESLHILFLISYILQHLHKCIIDLKELSENVVLYFNNDLYDYREKFNKYFLDCPQFMYPDFCYEFTKCVLDKFISKHIDNKILEGLSLFYEIANSKLSQRNRRRFYELLNTDLLSDPSSVSLIQLGIITYLISSKFYDYFYKENNKGYQVKRRVLNEFNLIMSNPQHYLNNSDENRVFISYILKLAETFEQEEICNIIIKNISSIFIDKGIFLYCMKALDDIFREPEEVKRCCKKLLENSSSDQTELWISIIEGEVSAHWITHLRK